MQRLQHKCAIVTGGAVGIGRACVQRMAEEGAKVAIFEVLDTEGRELADTLAGLIGVGNLAPCHASKGAVRLMSKNGAITYAAEGTRVNSIHPAYLWTPDEARFVTGTELVIDGGYTAR